MVDSIGGEPTSNDAFFAFFVLVAVGFCCVYCCKTETPMDDPAQDPMMGYIPNPSSRATPSLEEKRQHIEDNLIIRQVVAAKEPEAPTPSAPPAPTATDDEKKKPMLERMAKSERTFASYASALKMMTTSKKKIMEFSDPKPNFRKSSSLPVSFPENKNEEDDENDEEAQQVKVEADDDKKKEEEEEKKEETHDNDDLNTCSIKHRRKADIMVRTLAHTLSANQDYDQPTTCDICLLDYEEGEELAWSHNEGCIHAFHKECITDWLLRNPKCPLCRRDYVTVE